MTEQERDQKRRQVLAILALDYIRAVARVLVEEIEKGYPVSDDLLKDIETFQSDAYELTESAELEPLKPIFGAAINV